MYLDSAFEFRALFDSPEWKSGVLQSPQPPTPRYDDNSVATERVDLRRIQAPALALYAVPGSAEVMFPYWQAMDPTSQARGYKTAAALASLHGRLGTQFRNEVDQARVVVITGARHYIFLTHQGEVVHAMLEFLQPS